MWFIINKSDFLKYLIISPIPSPFSNPSLKHAPLYVRQTRAKLFFKRTLCNRLLARSRLDNVAVGTYIYIYYCNT